MSTQGKGTYLINSSWASGSLVFYEKAVGRTATGDIFTLSTTAVKVGNTSQDVDFQIYGTGSKSVIVDIGASTFTLTGITLTTANKGISVTDAALNASTGRVGKFSGSVAAPNHGDGYGAHEIDITASGTVAGTTAASSTWLNFAAAAVPGANMICVQNNGIYLPSGITASSAKMIMGMRMQYVADDGANPGSLFLFSTNIYSNALTALFDVNAIADMGGSTGAQTGNDYKIPLFKDASANQLWYINVYHS
jgi:hypothetical protein